MNPSGPCELLHKVLVIGEGATGKTCLIRRYVHGIFHASNKSTIGVDFALKVLNHNNRSITLQIWDIAGQERYGQMTRVYYQSAVGALVVADATRPDTLDAAIKWKQDLDSKVYISASGKGIPAVLLLNKIDLVKNDPSIKRKTAEEMDAFCKLHGFAGWFETSAKEDDGVIPAFTALVDHVLAATSDMQPETKPTNTVKPSRGKKDSKKCC